MAVNTSAVLGWLVVAGPISAGINGGGFLQFFGALIWAAAIGLPVAFAMSWFVAAPILKRVMRKNITWLRAVTWGATIGFCVALVSTIIGRLRGFSLWLNPDAFTQLGGGDKVREIDGILTTYGWLMVTHNAALFIAASVFIALLVRAIIGPGRRVK